MATEVQTQSTHPYRALIAYMRRLPERIELQQRNLVVRIHDYGAETLGLQVGFLDCTDESHHIEYTCNCSWVVLNESAGYHELMIERRDESDDLGRIMNSWIPRIRVISTWRLPDSQITDGVLAAIFRRVLAVIAADALRRLKRERMRSSVRNTVRKAPAPPRGRTPHWERGCGL